MQKNFRLFKHALTSVILFLVSINNLYSQSPCTNTSIISSLPAMGPVGTAVTLTGTGFTIGTGTTSVKFNGIEAQGFTVVSATTIKATVPAGATTGSITTITNGCQALLALFTVSVSNCIGGNLPSELYISELYDHVPGSYGVIELYNPTGSVINFNGNYVLERYGDVGASPADYTLILPGSIGPESTYLVLSYGTGEMGCSILTNADMGTGINADDEFKLKKNNLVIDVARAPSEIGYTVIRQPDAVAPSTVFNSADWNFNGTQSCGDLGNHATETVTPAVTITTQPLNNTTCENGTASFTVVLSNPAGFTYQWKRLNSAGIWVNVVNGNGYSGVASATLTINPVILALDGTQYYCEMTSTGCMLISNAAQLNVSPLPVATTTITQPTCAITTGSFIVNATTGTGLTYSFNGGAFQSSPNFVNIQPGNYNLIIKTGSNCTTTLQVNVNAVPNAPAAPTLSAIQPTCAVATGTITVAAPTGNGLTYSSDGINYQSGVTFANLATGSYPITVKNADGCVSAITTQIINAVPNAPAAPTVSAIQPTCAVTTGTITISTPTGNGLTYSIDGINYQPGVTFTSLAPGSYPVTVKNADECVSAITIQIINAVQNAPAAPTVSAIQPTCAVTTGTITISTPTGDGLTYSIDGINYQSGVTFTSLAPGSYPVTVKNADGCVSAITTQIINAAPNSPAAPIVSVIQPACAVTTGTITISNQTGNGLTYSIDGVNYQSGVTFANLAPGSYSVTVKNADGCISNITTQTINSVPASPQVSGIQGCRETIYGKNYILEGIALANSFDINTAIFEWRNENNDLIGSENMLNVTQYLSTSQSNDFPMEFMLKVITTTGCENTISFTVDGIFCDIPRGISPNNDDKNDTFNLSGLVVNHLAIFNRYGKEVYSRNNYTNEWHGQSGNNDELPTGTYYYIIETDGNSKTGWVYINRQQN